MSFLDERTAFEKRLVENWTTTPIKWENVDFDPPLDSTGNFLPYIAFHLRRNPVPQRLNLGSDTRWYRWTGAVIMQIFVPENTGPWVVEQYANLLKDLWLPSDTPLQMSYNASGIIHWNVPGIYIVGLVKGWYQVNVQFTYKRDAQQ